MAKTKLEQAEIHLEASQKEQADTMDKYQVANERRFILEDEVTMLSHKLEDTEAALRHTDE